MAFARDPGEPFSTTKPLKPLCTRCTCEPHASETIIGIPADAASFTTTPQGSNSDGRTNTEASSIFSASCSGCRKPGIITPGADAASRAIGPLPTQINGHGSAHLDRYCAYPSSQTPTPFPVTTPPPTTH